MKIVKLLRDFEPKPTEVMTPQNEQERQIMITVAFKSLAKCGLYVKNCSIAYEAHYQDGTNLDVTFFTTDHFPANLVDQFISPPHHSMFKK